MFKRVSFLLLAVALFVGGQLFLGCELEDDSEPGLAGYWKSAYGDGFEIADGTFAYFGEPDKTIGDMGFIGTIANDPDLDAVSGYITMLITASGSWGPTVGKYYTIHWKNLSETGVQQSSAYKTGGNNSGMDTQTAAATEYTVENGYFAFYSECVKQL